MRAILQASAALAATVLLVLTSGCGDSPPPTNTTNTEVTVKGVVKIDGVPATEGQVEFDPSNYERQTAPRKVDIGKDGSYSIKTYPGQNNIKLLGEVAHKNPILQQARLRYDVPSSETTHDLEFSAK